MSGSATSCEECLLIHPSCAWCAQEVLPMIVGCIVLRISTLFKQFTVWCVRYGMSHVALHLIPFITANCNATLSVLQDFERGRTLKSRCDFIQNLQKRGCDKQFIEYPTSSISVRQNMPLSSKGSYLSQYNVVQIKPQELSLSLRPGECSRRHVEPDAHSCRNQM